LSEEEVRVVVVVVLGSGQKCEVINVLRAQEGRGEGEVGGDAASAAAAADESIIPAGERAALLL
jgi:hypothetical protein